MKKVDQIIKQIEAGNYEILHEEDCYCYFYWGIDEYGRLKDTDETSECWITKSLWVDGIQVVMRDTNNDEEWLKGICRDDISDHIWSQLDCLSMTERWETGCSETHDARRREELIEWLLACGFELDKEYPRDFANEYTMVLREHETAVENTREACEKWADAFLYLGDAATQAYVGFEFIPWSGR